MKNLTWWIVGGVVVLLVVILAAKQFNAYQPPSTTQSPVSTLTESVQPSTGVSIQLTSSGFEPQEIKVKAGTKVIWTNKSGALATVNSALHPTHQEYLPLNLGEFADGATLSLVFGELGTYRYHNHLNPTQFGRIVVE